MNCTIDGCPGVYESRRIVQTFNRDGQTIVVEYVPADVCPVGGDTLLNPSTVRMLEQVFDAPPEPSRTIPVVTFPLADADGASISAS